MQAVQLQIAEQLKVQPPFADENALQAEVARGVSFSFRTAWPTPDSRPWCWASAAAWIL